MDFPNFCNDIFPWIQINLPDHQTLDSEAVKFLCCYKPYNFVWSSEHFKNHPLITIYVINLSERMLVPDFFNFVINCVTWIYDNQNPSNLT